MERNMADADHRDRINFLRLLLIIGLVFLHYGTFPGSEHSPYSGSNSFDPATPIASFVNSYFVFLFYSAVPVLGAISGYLFFKDWMPGGQFYLTRIRSRTYSILLPMISWCAIILALFVLIRLASPNSSFLSLIEYDLNKFGITQFINSLVGLTRRPINFQFWFLHDLFLTVLFAPVLGLLIRRAPFLGLAIIGVIYFAGINLVIFFRNDVLFFFYLGGLIRVRDWNLDFIAPRTAAMAMAAYVVIVGLRTLAPIYVPEHTMLGEFIFGPGTRILRLLGVVAFWGCAPFLMRTAAGRLITTWGTLAFFLHAIHWPLNQFIKAGLAQVFPADGELSRMVNYMATIALTLAAAFVIAWMLNAVAPKLFSHLSGGRAFGRAKIRTASVAPVAVPTADTAIPPEGAGRVPYRS